MRIKYGFWCIHSFIFLLFAASILGARDFDFDQAVSELVDGSDYFRFYTTNNINIRGDVARHQGDDFNTGTLLLESKIDGCLYAFNLTLYTQSLPEFTTTQRVDVVELSLGKSLGSYDSGEFAGNIYLFGHAIISGNFGGEALQTLVHNATKNNNISLPYSADRHATIGFTARADSVYRINEYQYAFANVGATANTDGSGDLQMDIGTVRHYGRLALKLLVGIKYISPLKQELVALSTVNRVPKYAIVEAGLKLSDTLTLFVGSKILGDNPYGNQPVDPTLQKRGKVDDPFSYLNVLYRF
ncbi:MAG TPA: hypothetical protein ENK77_01745 [Epsilonproteobacteria bacterium]|nr:hypothetical protein [Campylobacterota bacterium]